MFRGYTLLRGSPLLRATGAGAALLAAVRAAAHTRVDDRGHLLYLSQHPTILPALHQERTLFEFMQRRIAAAPADRPAAVQAETGEQYTYGELAAATEHVAEVLYHEAGVRRGDGVCIAVENCIHFGPLVYGTLRLGAVVSTLNSFADVDTMYHYFRESRAKVVLGTHAQQAVLEAAAARSLRADSQKVRVLYPREFLRHRDARRPIPADYDGLAGAAPDDTIFVPFSSGTTGLPKGVQLTNRSLTANILQSAAAWQLTPQDVSITVLPLYHIYGFTTCLNLLFASHALQVVMASYSLDVYMTSIARYRATVNNIAPPIAVSLLKNLHAYRHLDLSSLRVLRCGAAPMTTETERLLEERLPGCAFAQTYGTTETSPIITCGARDAAGKTYGSSGGTVPDTEVRIVRVDDSQQSGEDRSAGIDVPKGAEGEIWVRGPQLMKGYLKEEDTAKCMQDGWYRTGDIGKFDLETGDLVITDRLKELIKYKGFQVSPAALEGVLLDHPWVQDCIVVGVADPRDVSFEVPRALVVLSPDLPTEDAVGASDHILHFTMKRLAPNSRLHGGVRVVKEIPKTASGKLLRRVARQREVAYLKSITA
uniref:4-coumarate--CoA ligase n=1 Tax=Strigomonas culicis TaxID=28005 RepID=T1YTE3_9TRYP|nr:4-coumarate--CoA ligase [Strigomonas culicis]